MDQRFEACLPFILKYEGGNDDDPRDHGGRTSRGITQREDDKWRKDHGLATVDVWTETNANIKQIYFDNYWLPRCPKLRPGVDLVYFNIAVNAGPGRAEAILTKSIGGSDTDTVNRMCDNLMSFYHGLSQFSIYGRGWTNRTDGIRAAALKMVGAPEVKPPVVPPVQPPAVIPKPEKPKMGDTIKEIDENVTHFQGMLPMILGVASMFFPQLKGLILFLPAIQKIFDAVHAVQAARGGTLPQAVAEVTDHITPGAPDSSVLSRDKISTG